MRIKIFLQHLYNGKNSRNSLKAQTWGKGVINLSLGFHVCPLQPCRPTSHRKPSHARIWASTSCVSLTTSCSLSCPVMALIVPTSAVSSMGSGTMSFCLVTESLLRFRVWHGLWHVADAPIIKWNLMEIEILSPTTPPE